MPPWLEILLDVIGFAGFIVLAMFHRPRRKMTSPPPDAPRNSLAAERGAKAHAVGSDN
jgi:hypothetical protein